MREEKEEVVNVNPGSVTEVKEFVNQAKESARDTTPMPGTGFCSKMCSSVSIKSLFELK